MRYMLALLVALWVPGLAQACTVATAAQVKLRLIAGVPVVDLVVNSVPLPFVFDTGAERTMVTDDGVARAAIKRDTWTDTWVRGISGYERHPNADPVSLTLGGLALRRHTLAKDISLAVGPLPQGAMRQQGLAGLLGIDFLGGFDIDLDVPRLQATLYRVSGCAGRFLPWPDGYQAIAASQPRHDVLILPAALDGMTLRAEIDSGSSVSLLTASGMVRLGLSAPGFANDPTGAVNGVGRFTVPMRRHIFATLRIGTETSARPELWVAEVRVAPIVDLLLGGAWLRQHRVWWSFATNQIFIATAP